MDNVSLKSLHDYLRLLENTAELKRKIPSSSNPRTLKEGLCEVSRLVGAAASFFNDPPQIAALIGTQRFIMIWGEPSTSDQVARIFDGSRVLLTVLLDLRHFAGTAGGYAGSISDTGVRPNDATASLSPNLAQSPGQAPATAKAMSNAAEVETSLGSLKPLLAGNTPLACRLFRVLFEHLLGFASLASTVQGSISLVNDLTGSREHSRSFLATALFILGAEIDRENLMAFMMRQGLFGIPMLEHMLQSRDYCDAFYTFRRLERAFMGSPEAEGAGLRTRLDGLNAHFGGKPHGGKLFEADDQDKVWFDACWAATDLLEAMALTPWCLSLNRAVSQDVSHSYLSMAAIAKHFERFGRHQTTQEAANRAIADHLLAFGRQFSADTKSIQLP